MLQSYFKSIGYRSIYLTFGWEFNQRIEQFVLPPNLLHLDDFIKFIIRKYFIKN